MRSFAASAPPSSPTGDDDEKSKHAKPKDEKASPAATTKTAPPSILPGVALSAVTALGGFQTAAFLSSALAVPISGIPVSIVLGMALKNSIGYSDATFKTGITFATKPILQTGIVCVAAKLSFGELLVSSASSIPVVIAAVGSGMLFVPAAGKWAGLPPRMTLLLTAGTSICGVTAITALAPALQAPPRDIAVAVANTVAFGTLGMLVYPYLFHYLCDGNSTQVGMCLGVAIHDTSQVLGSALSYKEMYGNDEVAFQVAAVTKLLRNLGLAVAIPALSYQYAKSTSTTSTTASPDAGSSSSSSSNTTPQPTQETTLSGLVTFTQKYVPPFLMAFLGMSTIRSCGDFALVETALGQAYFTPTMNWIGNDMSKYLLGTAMAGVGLSTSASSLRGVGWKPFAVGGAGALVVGGTGFAAASMLF